MTSTSLTLRDASACRWDIAALGEIMLRLDPGEGRIRTAREFRVWEGGGEYNVARAARKCFGHRATVVTALPRNEIGALVEDCVLQGGVDVSHILWRDFDGIGAVDRVGLNFTERGFGLRPALGVSDRAHSAASRIRPGEIDWDRLFGEEGVRWFHTGGVFASLAPGTDEVALEAIAAARRHGTIVSYDLNYRPSLWQERGGPEAARALNRRIMGEVDVLIGVEGQPRDAATPDDLRPAVEACAADFPNLKMIATTFRRPVTASANDWGGCLWADGRFHASIVRPRLDILDRVGGGDGFVSGLVHACLEGLGPQAAVDYGAAHGALVMTTPGDTSMATLADVEHAAANGSAHVVR